MQGLSLCQTTRVKQTCTARLYYCTRLRLRSWDVEWMSIVISIQCAVYSIQWSGCWVDFTPSSRCSAGNDRPGGNCRDGSFI